MRIYLLIVLLVFFSCKTSNVENKIRDKERDEWIFAFKSNVFNSCIKNSGVVIDNDASPSLNFEVLGDVLYLSKTDSLGKSFSKAITQRSAWVNDAELENYKAIVNGCLKYYDSKELDSIANVEYRKYIKK